MEEEEVKVAEYTLKRWNSSIIYDTRLWGGQGESSETKSGNSPQKVGEINGLQLKQMF